VEPKDEASEVGSSKPAAATSEASEGGVPAERAVAWFRRIGDQDIYQGHIWRVVVSEFEDPGGERFQRDIVRSPGAVAAVPLVFDAEGNPSVVLLAQYRPAYERELVEIPAGMRDVDGEPPEETARRELAEEVGLMPGRLDLLIQLVPQPGMSDGTTMVYLATECSPAPTQPHGPEEEHARTLHVPLADAVTMVERGEITDAKSVAGLLLTERRLRSGDHGP
jgi:ADP-ribose pyrophosphatase